MCHQFVLRILCCFAALLLPVVLSSCDCKQDGPKVGSPVSAGITITGATLGGTVTSVGGTGAHYYGAVVSRTADNPAPFRHGYRVMEVVASRAPEEFYTTGPFTVRMEGLEPGTQYSFRAFVSSGDADTGSNCHSAVATFTTPPLAGAADVAFTRPAVTSLGQRGVIHAVAMQPDGRVLIGGDFTTVNSVPRPGLARLQPDGTVDLSFEPEDAGAVNCVAVLADGKIVCGGRGIRRLQANGDLDRELMPGPAGAARVTCLAVQPDGRILASGALVAGLPAQPRQLLRFAADGSLEAPVLFAPNGSSLAEGTVNAIAVQRDGRIVIGGDFTSVAGQPRQDVARLMPDGTVESAASFDAGSGAAGQDARIHHIAQSPDGRLLVFGRFSSFNGLTRRSFVRLLPNGAVDPAFVPSGPQALGDSETMALQADGQVLTMVNGRDLGRLTATGLPDTTINAASYAAVGMLKANMLALGSDGEIFVGRGREGAVNPLEGDQLLLRLINSGGESILSATSATRVQWLRRGALPEVSQVTFEFSGDGGNTWTPLGAGLPIAAGGGWELTGLNLTTDGRLRARGRTHSAGELLVNGNELVTVSSTGLVQEIADVTVGGAPLISSPAVSSAAAESASLQANVTYAGGTPVTERGVVVALFSETHFPEIGGSGVSKFTAFGTTGLFTASATGLLPGKRYVFRGFATNSHGTTYTAPVGFDTGTRPFVHSPTATNITGNSARLGGSIGSDGGAPVYERGIVYASSPDRLMSNTGVTKVVVSGSASTFSTTISGLTPGTTYAFAAYALNIVGLSYSPVATFTTTGGTATSFSNYAQALAVQPDGKMIVGGLFQVINGVPHASLVRLNPDSSPDGSFTATIDGSVYCVAVQPDGRILIGGAFNNVNGEARSFLARLLPDGSVESDSAWRAGTGPNRPVSCLALQPDGGILLGGAFTSVNNRGRNGIARLLPDGSVEGTATFNPGTGADDSVFSIALQDDGSILLGGAFQNVNGSPRTRLARLAANGALEGTATFNPGTGPNGWVHCLVVQPDGKFLAGGDFTSVNGTARGRVARFNGDGSLDDTFDPGSGADGKVFSLTLQADGRIFASGTFQNFNGAPRGRFVRLNAGGSLDVSLQYSPVMDGEVDGVALFPGGVLQLAGAFTRVNSVLTELLARVANTSIGTQTLTFPSATTARWLRSNSAPEVAQVVFEQSTDGIVWTSLGAVSRIAGGWEVSGFTVPSGDYQIRARGRTSGGYLSASSGIAESLVRFGTDSDGDGLLDSWEIAHFGTTDGPTALGDSDRDGCVELLELAFGGDPLHPDYCQPAIVEEGGYLTVTITKQPGVTYTVESAASLFGPWSAATTTTLVNDATTLQVRDNFTTASATHRFVRVRVTAAP